MPPLSAHILINAAIALLYWGVSHLTWGYFQQYGMLPAPLWPAAAIALTGALRYGPAVAPGIYLGAVLANGYSLSAPWPAALGIGVMNTVGPVLAGWLLSRSIKELPPFRQLRDVWLFLLWGVALHAALTATGGIGSLLLGAELPLAAAPFAWLRWWIAHAGAVVLFVPALLLWLERPGPGCREVAGESLGVALVAVGGAGLIFFGLGGERHAYVGLPLLLIIPIAWGAARLPLRHTASVLPAVLLLATAGTVAGHGPFHLLGNERPLVTLGLMGLAFAATILVLAAVSAERRREAERYRLVVENSNDFIVVLDRAFGITFCSPGYCTLLDRPPEAVLGREMASLVTAAEREKTREALLRLRAPPHRGEYEEGIGSGPARRWISWSTRAVLNDAGEVESVIAVGREITEIRRAEQSLRENEELLRGVLDNLVDIVYRNDLMTGRYDYLTAPFEQVTGYTCEEASGFGFKRMLEHVHPDDRGAVERAFERALATGRAEVEYRFRHKQGLYRWLADHFSIKPGPDGLPRFVIGVARDITGRRQAEETLRNRNAQMERLNAELEEFAYVASHDLKAPLRAVANLAAWIEEDAADRLDEENRARLRLMRERMVRMDQLINGLLDYARLGHQEAAGKEAVPVEGVIEQLLRELPLPEGFRVQIASALPALEVDPLHLRQIFQNLISNAVEHHDRGEGTIRIAAEAVAAGWHITVADDGPGIPAQARQRIFQMFNTSAPEGHTGIGLAVVRKLALNYGARVEVTANSPRGSVFRLIWPKPGSSWEAQESDAAGMAAAAV